MKNEKMMKMAPRYDIYWMNKTPKEKEKMYIDLQGQKIGFDI